MKMLPSSVDRPEDVGFAVRRTRHVVTGVHVIELDPEFEVLLDDVLDGDGRFPG